MSDRLAKFNKLKQSTKTHKTSSIFNENIEYQASSSQTAPFLLSTMDTSINVAFAEADKLIYEIRENWEKSKFETVLYNCKKDAMHSVISAFGLGSIVAGYDKTGGNVTTVHNAKQNIYAKDEQVYTRGQYTGKGSDYRKSSLDFRDSQIDQNFNIKDGYTNNELYYKDSNNKSSVDVDHVKSVKSYHQEGGFIQTKEQKQAFAADKGNFVVTDKSINRSMKADDIQEWSAKTNKTDNTVTNAEFYEINEKNVNEAKERSNETVANHAPSTKEWTGYYTKEIALTGAKDAGKMGFQMAVGLLLTNFFEALFNEVKDAYENGFRVSEKTFFESLKIRLKNISEHVLKDWKKVVIAFQDGAIAGFLSNLLTVAINTVFTTAKRLVRMIREGVMSLIKAVKLLVFRPTHMTKKEAADAAVKLLATGVITGVGIIAEEAISKAVVGLPFADFLSVALTTSLVAIATSMTIYALDRYDFFGINEDKCHEFTMKQLAERMVEKDQNINRLYEEAMSPF